MSKKGITTILLFSLLLLINSCSTMQLVTFETLQPAQTSMPPHTEQVLFVNRLTDRSCRIGNSYTNIANETKLCRIESDSLQQSAPSTLYTALQENFYFPPISYVENGIDLSTTTEFPIITFDAVTLDTYLTEEYIADYLYYTRFEVQMQAVLTLYSALGRAPQTISFCDTIAWDGEGYTLEDANASLPYLEDAIEGVGDYIAESIAQKFSPYHAKSDRVLYEVPSSAPMRDANRYWWDGDYEEARYLWEYAYQHGVGKKRRAMAASNVALCFELQDNLEVAIQWLEKALLLLDNELYNRSVQAELIDEYLVILKQRVITDSRVVKQLQ